MEKFSWMVKLMFIISPNKTILSWTEHHLPSLLANHKHLLDHQGQRNQTESSTSE
jgi:hypothetical protein